jgi:hypothetical protein
VDEKKVYSKHTIEFVTIAAEYCAFVEQKSDIKPSEFVSKLQKLLAALYLKATLLPDVDSQNDDSIEKFVSEEDWDFVQKQALNKLGRFETYFDVPTLDAAGAIQNDNMSLSEVLSDLYQELMDFIALYRLGNEDSMLDALSECIQSFKMYWGTKLLSAQTALHQILYTNEDINQELPEHSPHEKPNTNDWIFSQRQRDWGLV